MKIRIEDINDYNQVSYFVFLEEMDPERQMKAYGMKNETEQKLCILSDNLMKRMISEDSGADTSMLAIYRDSNGKPRCMNVPTKFNISHSGTKAACAVSDKEIGIDIEINRPHPDKTTERFATEKEKEFIEKDESNFLKIWCLKEAYVKCLGTGIRGNLKDVEFEITDDGSVICSDSRISAALHNIQEGYTVATCEMKE